MCLFAGVSFYVCRGRDCLVLEWGSSTLDDSEGYWRGGFAVASVLEDGSRSNTSGLVWHEFLVV